MELHPVVIAHRGASGHRPEHGADAYRLAIDLGADAIEPDIVSTRDGVLVLRHENEISGTTDIADRPEFADRKTMKTVDGVEVVGWFTEDFTWSELEPIRIRERIPKMRPLSASYDGTGGIQRLSDLLALLDGPAARARSVALVAEIKHATYFDSIGLPLDALLAQTLGQAGWIDDPRLTVESFEAGVLTRVRERSVGGRYVYLVDGKGAPADLVARDGAGAVSYAEQLEPEGVAALADAFDGVSVPKRLLLDERGATDARVVDRAHAAGLDVLTWTLRPENKFLAEEHREGAGKRTFGDWRTEFGNLIRTGVDGVFTDYPELAVEARAETIATV